MPHFAAVQRGYIAHIRPLGEERADTLNVVVQLLLGALLVGGIDLWFITRALQGYTTSPPG